MEMKSSRGFSEGSMVAQMQANTVAVVDVPDQQDGEINENECESERGDEKCNFCKAITSCCRRCRRLYTNIADDRPDITEEDGDASFWNERAKCSRFSLLVPFVTALLFIADVGMDCEIAATHYSRGDYKWAAFTLGVIVSSLIITDALSAIFFLDDRKDEKPEQLRRNNLEVKPWFYAFHFIFCGRLVRCVQIFRTVRFIRKIQNPDPCNTELYRLYISQLQDLSTLGVVEAFTEETPQVALQLYILFQKGAMDWTSFADVFVAINIIKSLALFAFSLLSFCRFLRLGNETSQLLELFSLASVFHFSWRLFMLVSRILALTLFASDFKQFVFVVVGIHLLFSYFLLRGQPDNYFEEEPLRDILLRCAFICINLFCFFPLEGKRTRNWGIPYYLLTFIENSIMVLLWYFLSDFDKVFKMIMLITEWGAFLLGLVSVLLYYGVFHPSLKVRKNKEKADVADAQNITSFVQFESSV